MPALAATTVWGQGTTFTTDYALSTNWSGGPAESAGTTALFGDVGNTTVNVSEGAIAPDAWTFSSIS